MDGGYMMSNMTDFDYVVAGGGLQGGLLTLALRHHQPSATIALIERADRLGGNHTWCLHDRDIPSTARPWLLPLLTYRWSGYRILFPSASHTVEDPYSGVSSERLHEIVRQAVEGAEGSDLLLGADVGELRADRAILASGEEVRGTVIVDARGGKGWRPDAPSGYQKFFGMELELDEAHGLDLPIVMDARVDQADGYRFMYVLPMGQRRVLVEDTYFNASPAFDAVPLEGEVRAYVQGRGWTISRVVRTEKGVLPMPWSERIDPPGYGLLQAGYRGGWYHPGTGYSFPIALRLAEFVASRAPRDLFGSELDRLAKMHRRQASFARFLNRLMFRWYPPERRRPIFERVYRLPLATIRRFYALELGWRDRWRFLVGRPPPGLSLHYRFRPSPPDA
jgi:lycopene beta-cyclase